MPEERAIPGSDVIVWLSRVGAASAGPLLVGCGLDDGTHDEVFPLVGFDADKAAVVLEGGKRVRLASLAACVVLDSRPGHPLYAAIEASRTPADTRERAERAELARAGIRADRLGSPEARRAVLAVLRMAQDGKLPGRSARHAFYRALTEAGDRSLAQVAAQEMERQSARFALLGQEIPGDLYWRRAALLRSLGQLKEAVAVSDVLHQDVVKDPTDRMLLATTRAAALLDLHEATGEASWLALAGRAYDVAKAIRPEETSVLSVGNRLRKLRG